MNEPTDEQLVADCLNGRIEAFGELVVRHQVRLYRSLIHTMGSSADAQDVVQDTFLLAFRKLKSFRGDATFSTWLFRIAFNSAMTEKRRRKRKLVSVDEHREETGLEPVDGHADLGPSYHMELSERQQMVRVALAELQEEYRVPLVLKEMEDLSYEEIAEILQCPIGTVRSRIFRARQSLREKLKIRLKSEV